MFDSNMVFQVGCILLIIKIIIKIIIMIIMIIIDIYKRWSTTQ